MKRLWLVVAVVSLCLTGGAQAATSSLDINVDVSIDAELKPTVSYTLSGTNASETSTFSVPIIGIDIEDPAVEVNGDKVVATTETVRGESIYDVAYTSLNITMPGSARSAGSKWQATVEYTAPSLTFDAKQLKSIAFPALPYELAQTTETVNITMPIEMGLPIAFGLQPTDSVVTNGEQTYTFTSEELRTESIILQLGEEVAYELTQTHKLENNSWWWKSFTVTAPPDTNQQKVYLENVTPKPKSIKLDRDGNILLEYSLAPRQKLEVKTTAKVVVRSLSYNVSSERPVSDVPESLRQYTETSAPWDGGNKQEADSAIEALRAVYDNNLGSTSADPLEAINQIIADARATGLPARLVQGLAVHNGSQSLTELATTNWAEVYVPGSGWLSINPSTGQHYRFGLADAFHIATYIHGVGTEISDTATTASYTLLEESPNTEPGLPSISQHKYMILPGVSLIKTAVSMPVGAVRDGLGYRDSKSSYKLGSLAPLQEVSHWAFGFGNKSWSGDNVAVGLLSGEELEALTEGDSSLVWWPLALGVLTIGGAIAGGVWWHRRTNKPFVMNEADEDDGLEAEELLKSEQADHADQDS